jgi:hypothetical protein
MHKYIFINEQNLLLDGSDKTSRVPDRLLVVAVAVVSVLDSQVQP